MKKWAWLAVAASLAWVWPAVADEFRDVKCGSDIPAAMIGRKSSRGPTVKIEAKYPALGLKHLGADELPNGFSSIDWQICGSQFMVLEDRKDVVRDVLLLPPHSRKSPAFSGYCKLNGRELPDLFFAVLNGEATGDLLPALSAWKIDLKAAKFVKAPVDGLLCPRTGIYTVDGGR